MHTSPPSVEANRNVLIMWAGAAIVVCLAATFLYRESLADALKVFDLTLLDAQMILVFCGLFPGLLWLLSHGIIRPHLAVIEARESATEGATDAAAVQLEEAARIDNEFELRMAEVRAAVLKEKQAEIARAKEHAREVLAAAERDAQRIGTAAKEAAEKELDSLRTDLLVKVPHLAGLLVERIRSAGGAIQ